MFKSIIYKYFFSEVAKSFLIVLFTFTAIAWTVRAVNFLDLVIENTLNFKTYFFYSLLYSTNIVTKFEDGFERKNTNQLTLKPGCMLFEGRYGNSIMFHSNDKQKPIISIRTDDATDGVIYDGSPQSDDSSIYLTSDGMDGTFDGEPIQGKNVLIQSDNILINGREKVRISSSEKKDIELKAGKGIILNPGEKQTVKMGDPRAPMLPTVNGQKLLEFQTSILGILADRTE